MTTLSPAPGVATTMLYAPSRHLAPCDLDLSGTEAVGTLLALRDGLPPEALTCAARYPDARALDALIAARFGIEPDRVIVTAGADDALDRACRAVLTPAHNAILTAPTFEMLPRYVALAGASVRTARWPAGAFPTDDVIALADDHTALVAIVSPNNPTGAVASIADIRRIHDAVPSALIVADLAYVEFADADPTADALALPRVVVVRTLSKAWGLPGLRVGYALGSTETVAWLRRAGSPFPVSSISLALGARALESGEPTRDATVAAVRRNRGRLQGLLEVLGAAALPGQANFVAVAGRRARWIHDALAGFGIATRLLAADEVDRVRITVPADDATHARLEYAVRSALDPDAILFDLDGVLADVSQSYREAVRLTAAKFGVSVSAADIGARKALGHANDDWALTAEFVASAGGRATLAEVTESFERLYQGDGSAPALRDTERLTVPRDWLTSLAARYPLGIVTGRPRADAERFLARFDVRECFRTVVAREDGPLKPDAFPVATACRTLGAARAWMLGDTPDDIASARGAGALGIGVVAPGDTPGPTIDRLLRRGAARVLTTLAEFDACLR